MNKSLVSILLVVSVLGLPCVSNGAPSVSGVSGTVTNGSSIIVSGTGFGVKSSAAPLAYYNFDSCTTGQNVLTSCAWEDLGTDGTVVSVATDRYYGSTGKSSKVTYNGGEQFPEIGNYTSSTDKIYISFNFYYSFSVCDFPVFKWSRAGYGTPYSGTPRFYDTVFPLSNCSAQETYDRGFVTSSGTTYDPYQFTNPQPLLQDPGSWKRIEYYYLLSTPGTSNGFIKSWTDQTVDMNISGVTRTASESGRGIEWVMSPFDGQGSDGFSGNMSFWIDNYYLDNTPQRVEICNASTRSSCTHCEIQIPSGWSDTSATVTVNRGTFGATDTAYVYVTDASNVQNSSGYSITFGSGGGDTTAPSVSITTSDPSTITSDSLTVTGTASDAAGVSSCKYRIGSAPDASNGTACTGTTSWFCSTSGFSVGANTLYVGCGDAAGNWGSDSMVVNLSGSGLPIMRGVSLRKISEN